MKNNIFLRRRNRIFFSSDGNSGLDVTRLVATALANIQQYDYNTTFGPNLLAALRQATPAEIEKLYHEVLPVIKEGRGAHVVHQPMYPNFPTQVMEAREAELLLNALVHYWSGGRIKPEGEKLARPALAGEEPSAPAAIEIGDEEEFVEIFANLMRSPTSLSSIDRDDLLWFLRHYRGALQHIPGEIPFKETAALVASVLIEKTDGEDLEKLQKYLKTATDVLRLATVMSGGDSSLAEHCRFKSFRRRERRILLTLLESLGNIEEDMARQPRRWLRLGERLHPGEFSKLAKVAEAFHKLRAGLPMNTFNGHLNRALAADFLKALALLESRPGELARRLDSLLRSGGDQEAVLKAFENAAGGVSTRVLLQVREHFRHRSERSTSANVLQTIKNFFRPAANHLPPIRVFLPKGQAAKAFYGPDRLPPLSEKYCHTVVDICEKALLEAYAKRPPMGRVFVAKELANYVVPFSQRSAAKALKTIGRGSRIAISPSAKTIRGFLWWRNGRDRTDLDLSAVLLDESWNYLEHISYTNLRSAKYQACHSGDIVDAPKGASEYIDIDISSVVQYGGRYVVYCVFSYTQQPFCDLPECFMGWMERVDPKAGEIFEPPTVAQKIDLTSNTRVCLPVVFDLKEKVFIWADLGFARSPLFNNIESHKASAIAVCRAVAEMKKPNLYDLIKLNITARGEETDDKSRADLIFEVNEGVTPFDGDTISADYL